MQNDIFSHLTSGISIGTAPPSLQAMLIARMCAQKKCPVLWVVKDADQMYQSIDDLSLFLKEEDIEGFIPYDVRPYEDDSPSKEVIAQRIFALYRLLEKKPVVVVAPLDAVTFPTISRQDLIDSIIEIKIDCELSRNALIEKLISSGYTRQPLIDDVGQFSIRGFVIDIFSPGMESPVRIDLFGDTIERIREFDISTQRSKGDVQSIIILPCSEVLLDNDHLKVARPNLRDLKDPNIKHLIHDIEQKIHIPGLETYLPFFYERPSPIFEYLSGDFVVVSPDQEELTTLWKEVCDSHLHAYQKARSSGRPLPAFEKTVISLSEIFKAQQRSTCWISTSLGGTEFSISFQAVSLAAHGGYEDKIHETTSTIHNILEDGIDVHVVVDSDIQAERLAFVLTERGLNPERESSAIFESFSHHAKEKRNGRLYIIVGAISSGFILPETGLALISGSHIIGGPIKKVPRPKGMPISDPFSQLNLDDTVVHRDHGIGIFKGIYRLDIQGSREDFILLEYLGGDKLYIPVYRLNIIQRYIGDHESVVIDKLGSSRWSHVKKKAKESVEKLAGELLSIYARRESATGISLKVDSHMLDEFESSFAYDETEDQLHAIEQVVADMRAERPMDRLICGDVGYGKTEVALRASFIAAMSGKQVAVLVPTTLLASQHFATFKKRFEPWPLRIEAITSFSSTTKNKQTIEDLGRGAIDIIIGTHGLLTGKVKFKDLGLLVVDEEHRFGVAHKEKIKSMRAHVDILTLSATPIPRTLNMAITGIRDLSVIETPPLNRKSIETLIMRFDDDVISETIERELVRGGQVFFVHNQVSNIDSMADHIQRICPNARIGVGHGQMPRKSLEKIMKSFIERETTVLVSSAIIGSGIDIPNANTMIINRADKFGMADLYQLRGRVGRSKQKGHALLLIPRAGQVSSDARKRLSAMKEYESLGAGFQMALRDMEIRGAGEILGSAQWGQIAVVGYELYQQMLKEAVARLQGKPESKEIDPEIKIGLDAYIPEDYCPDQHLRLGLYRKLSMADKTEIERIREELIDMYGPIPEVTDTLLAVSELREIMKRLRVRKMDRQERLLRLHIEYDSTIPSESLISVVSKRNGRFSPSGVVSIPIEGRDILNEIFSVVYSLC